MTPIKKFYRQQSNTIIQNLERRNMKGYYCETKADAIHLTLSLMEDGSKVSFGGSMTLEELGLLDTIAQSSYELLDRRQATSPEEVRAIYLKAFDSDTYLMSANALSLDGHLVNIDGNGNRAAALIYGPKQVIVICGMNKVATDLDEAINRVKNFAAPPNTQRLSKNTPCSKTGFCHDCQVEDCICSHIVVTRRSGKENRIKVILVGEILGY